ncbi:hypothetical protein EDC01DRAFT_627227 [Geopyxis carbonaria]|nr:hypothetical protein EDC01DRAFT_627227 [Geopyxis carbonaria]
MSSNPTDPSTTTATTSTKPEQTVPPQRIPSPTRPEPTAAGEPLTAPTSTKSPLSPSSSRAAANDTNVSEAETEILSDAAASETRVKKEVSLENGLRKEKERERGIKRDDKERADGVNRRGAGGESPRKRRKRSVSRSRIADRDERRPKGVAIKEDPDDSSDLSSVLSSRHVSPSYLRRRMPADRDRPDRPSEQPTATAPTPRSHSQPQSSSTVGSDSRKRKTPHPPVIAAAAAVDGSTSSDDNNHHHHPPPPLRQKQRPRRNSTLDVSSPARRQQISNKFTPSSPMRASSPISRGAARRRPQHLRTTHGNNSDSDTDSSTSSSRPGSPDTRCRRLQSTARTPGSPINMSHRPKRDTAGRTHLHRACGKGVVGDVEAILEQGLELINSEDNAGYRPIHEASLKGHLDIVKVLVKYGADFDVQSKVDSESPLLDAVENGHVPVVKYLLDLGADPRKRDQRGRSCLDANRDHSDEAGEEEIREELEQILKSAVGKRRMQRPSDDETRASTHAPDRDSRSSRDPSVTSPARQSPPAPVQGPRRRNARAEQSRKDLLWLDSGKGSVIKLREKAREGDTQMVHALLETGLKPDNETLIGAIKGGHTECVNLLLAYSGDADPAPGQIDGERRRKNREASMPVGEDTPMLAAIGRGNVEILKMLLDNNVNPKRRDGRGKSYIEIAKEREGEFWQHEVQILEEAWRKATKKSTDKSPQHLKSSSPKASAKQQPRRSSSTSSRNHSRPPKIKEERGSNRSLSANPPHRLDDSAVVSDRESTAEPLGPPKNRMGVSRRSGSDSLTPGSPRRRRRLVSGKVRDEEAMSKVSDPISEKKRQPSKASSKRSDSEYGDTIRVEQPPTKKVKPKPEPSEDTKMAVAPPLDRRKVKDRERERLGSVKNSETRESKRPVVNRERSRSPPRAPKSDIEKRQELERRRQKDTHRDERVHRRRETTELETPRPREQRGSVSAEPGRHREEARRPVTDKPRLTEEERRRRLKDKEPEKEKKNGTVEREGKGLKATDREKREKERKTKIKQEKEREDEVLIEKEAQELIRQKCLIKEFSSIQKKAQKESKDARDNQVINRELENRRIREEEMRKERILREKEEQEQEEREALETARKEKEAKENEERERLLKKEAEERAVREREEKERLERERIQKEKEEEEARKRAEKERIEREAKERIERIEREAKEAREAEEKRLEEERQREIELKRQEEERIRLEEERQKKLKAEREEQIRKAEAENLRLEAERVETLRLEMIRLEEETQAQRKAAEQAAEKAAEQAAEEARKRQEFEEKEARDRKVAEELQQQMAKEKELRRLEEEKAAKEKARIEALPYALRTTMEREQKNLPSEDFRRFIPLYSATLPSVLSASTGLTNGASQGGEKYVLNVQCALALGTNDLDLSGYTNIERRPLSEHQRARMWCAINPMLIKISWDQTIQQRMASVREEKQKFLAMNPLFWIKLKDFTSIISTDPRYEDILNLPVTTIEVNMDIPTGCKGSPSNRVSREETQMRFKKRLRTSVGFDVSPDPTPTKKVNMNGSRTPPLPVSYPSKQSSMPPPNFAPNSNSTTNLSS